MNHRVLIGAKILDMFWWLRGKDKDLLNPLILRSIKYIEESTGANSDLEEGGAILGR